MLGPLRIIGNLAVLPSKWCNVAHAVCLPVISLGLWMALRSALEAVRISYRIRLNT